MAALTALVGGAPAAAAGRVQYVPESALVAVRSNALGLRRAQDLMDEIARDSQQQVEVHAALVEVNLSRGLQYGIEWDRVIPTGRLLGAGSSMSLSLGGQGATVNVPPNVTTQSVKAVITALQSLTDVRVIAQPSAITLNHMDAVLYRGRQVPYLAEVSTTTAANVGATSSARVAYVPEGTSIALRASVIDAQRVDLRIAPQQIQGITFRNFTFGANNTLQAPTFPLAQALLQLIVEQGRTYVIGGLNLETDQRDDSGVPGLADLPLFGPLFTATQRGTSRSQLVLLLTARILPAPAVVDSLIGASL
jgi:type II secretory pathway component GspD/PulD (secretin)